MIHTFVSSFYGLLETVGYPHPVHPILVHITVGLVFGAFVLGLLARLRRQPELRRSAWHCMLIAFISIIPALVTGLMDWHRSYAAALLFPFKMKFVLAVTLLTLLTAGFFLGRSNRGEANGMVAIYTLCLVAVCGLGYFGGNLVYGGKNTSNPKDYRAGEKTYAANCGGCHANGGNSIKPGLPVKNSSKLSDLDTFRGWVRSPNAPMPAFPETAISNAEVEDMYHYVVQILSKPGVQP